MTSSEVKALRRDKPGVLPADTRADIAFALANLGLSLLLKEKAVLSEGLTAW